MDTRQDAPSSGSSPGLEPRRHPAHALPCSVTIPPLACSQPLRLHPSYASIRVKVDAWLVSAVKPSTIQEEERLVQFLLPFLACAGYVDVEESLCLVAAKFFAWLFLYDDINDDVQEGLGAVHGAADTFLKELHKVLLTREATMAALSNVADCHQAAAAIDVWLAWWSELRTHLSPAYQARFLESLQRYAASSATQVGWRQAAHIPDLYTCIGNRRDCLGIYAFFNILGSGLGVHFDMSVLDCPLLTLLRSAATDHVSWVNDLFSFKKEYVQSGDFCNILAVVWLQPSSPSYGDLQKSVDIVCKMIEQRDQDFARLLKEAQGCGALMEKPGMAHYLQGIADWLSGSLHWSYSTARYYDCLERESPRLVDVPLTLHF